MGRDALSERADNAIDGFGKTFQDLWKSLQETFSVDNIEQTYRLVAATECIAAIGPSKRIIFPCGFSCRLIAVDEHLDRLPGATLSWVEYDKHKACLSGTRMELLKDIEEWIHTSGDREHIL